MYGLARPRFCAVGERRGERLTSRPLGGIVAGSNAAISSVLWMPYYPVWSLVSTGLGVAVIYGLTVCEGKATDRVR